LFACAVPVANMLSHQSKSVLVWLNSNPTSRAANDVLAIALKQPRRHSSAAFVSDADRFHDEG
jgi:hypothetical protein